MPWSTPASPSRPTGTGCKATLDDAGSRVHRASADRGREASEEILELLDEVAATLCVIGLRKRSAVGKMLLGSNAHKILMDAPCPVLSVRADDDGTDHG